MHPVGELSYRRDIDGMRAIAVSSVIAYHAFPSYFSGGYVGVDIFFVISGFLITSIILKSSRQTGFSVMDFYARRVRRIFPALITVLLACLIAGWWLLFPDEWQQLGKHTLGAAAFVSNFMFWSEAGYFDNASELKPLLHLWSLSIEEQFYALWPVTLLFFIRRKHPALLILLLTGISFLLCISDWLDKVANFYMPLVRAWELLLGACLAAGQMHFGSRFLVLASRPAINRVLMHGLSVLGFLMLCLGVFALNSKTVFPGWAALLPTLGAAMLIAAGSTALVNRYVLGNSLFVFIGLISYPLYLWHWPFLSFPKIIDGLDISRSTRVIAVIGSLFFAILTWLLIERPLRHQGTKTSILLFLVMILVGCCGFCFQSAYIQPRQGNDLFQKINEAKNDYGYHGALKLNAYTVLVDNVAYRGIGSGKKTTVFIGDSNMDQYAFGIQRVLDEHKGERKALLGGCDFPIRHVMRSGDNKPCIAINDQAYAMAANDPDIDTLVIAAQWRGIQNYQYVDGERVTLMSGVEGRQLAFEQLATDIHYLGEHGKKVYVILGIPGGPEFEPHNLIKRSLTGFHGVSHLAGGVALDKYQALMGFFEPAFIEAVKRGGGILLDPKDLLCAENWCSAVTPDGEPMYRDEGHLRMSYSYFHPEFISRTMGL